MSVVSDKSVAAIIIRLESLLAIHIVVFVVLLLVLVGRLGRLVQKSPRLRRFKSDRDEIWQECSSIKIRID